ncbi:hypothetical protein BS17DRAFT_772498 [Gyrodon lividus]|nr:hypothetical protein BS17DRAFT_772498 [Gyrodon lividus]
MTMRRRGPPSALRLFQGPLPPRSQPKHALPSIPRPAFHPEGTHPRCPTPARRSAHMTFSDLPPLDLEVAAICKSSSNGNSSPTSPPTSSPNKRLRGPWDDSSSIALVVDVDSILAMPKPVATGV